MDGRTEKPISGILCLDKPEDITSFWCCSLLRKRLQTKKIGHGGTLDPMATGVLPILVGGATRAMDILPVQDKGYRASFRFGLTSDTEDIWGHVSETGKPLPTRRQLEDILPAFTGSLRQIPPMMSALKKDGVRLYDLARQGIEVERESREIQVYACTLISYDEQTGEGTLDFTVSKGTYIRTLCSDIGKALGCGAVMTALRRTMAAGYTLDQCISLQNAKEMDREELLKHILPTETAFASYPAVQVTSAQANRFRNGGALALDRLPVPVTETVRVYGDSQFLGLGKPDDKELKIYKLFL